jgi:large subunit ribosomal protein L6
MIYKFEFLKNSNIEFLKEKAGYILKGPLGSSLPISYNNKVNVVITDSVVLIESSASSFFFLYKKLFLQKIKGVLYGYKIRLKLKGVGYIATILDNNLILKLGFSSPITMEVATSVQVKIKKRKFLKILGCDLNEITQFASRIRSYRVPEVYKGKGVLYFKEKIFLKVGKRN